MKTIKNIEQLPVVVMLNIMKLTGEITRFASINKSFKIAEIENNYYYLNITRNGNIFDKLKNILKSSNHSFLKRFWISLDSYDLFKNQMIGYGMVHTQLLTMIVKAYTIPTIINFDYFWNDFDYQNDLLQLIGIHKSLAEIKMILHMDVFIKNKQSYKTTFTHYTWQYNLAIGIFKSNDYEKIAFFRNNSSFYEQKIFPYYGFDSHDMGIQTEYISSMCKWITYENYNHYIKYSEIRIHNKVIKIKKFTTFLNFLKIAEGICSSSDGDLNLLKMIDNKGCLSYSHLLHIAVFYQNIEVIKWLIKKTLDDIKNINISIKEMQQFELNGMNVDRHMTYHLNDRQSIVDDISIAYSIAVQYPYTQKYFKETINNDYFISDTSEIYKKIYEKSGPFGD
tara:strand:- start:12648 stop:13829 length:1182 start_codon:yes stop_codon:yes gene_type:complete